MLKARISGLVLLVLFFSLFHGNAQAWENSNFTVVKFGGTSNDIPNSIKTDSAGNSYVSGYFSGTTDFDPSSSVESATSLGLADAFLAKYSSTGTLIWAKTFGGTLDDQVTSTVIDGNIIYLTGTYKGTVDFDYTSGVETATANASGTDFFVSKITLDGDRLWTKTFFGSTANETTFEITADSNGNLVVIGNYYLTVDFDPGVGTSTLTSTGSYSDIFVLKLTANGEFVWVRTVVNSQSNDEAQGVASFSNGDLVVVGGFGANTTPADFDPGSGAYLLSAGSTNHNIFIWKLTADGSFAWAKNIGNSSTADRAYSVVVDSSANVYTTGTFQSSAAFSPSGDTLTATSYDAFLTKHDAAGNFQWVKQFSGSGSEYGRRLAMDAASNIFVVGHFSTEMDLNPGNETTSVTSAGGADSFISKISPSGNFSWGRSLGSSSNDYFIATNVDVNGNVMSAGYMSANLTISSGSSTLTLPLTGGVDAFYYCLNPSGNYACGISEVNSTSSREEEERLSREEREKVIAKARNEVASKLSSGTPLTKENLSAADFAGVTDKNIVLINAELEYLSKIQVVDLAAVSKVVRKHEVLGRVEGNGVFYFTELLQAGIIDGTSPHRTMIMIQLRKLPRELVDSEVELKAAIAAIEKVYVERKIRLQEIIARIQSRSL